MILYDTISYESGLFNTTLIIFETPFAHEAPKAFRTETGALPVTIKSLPSGAIELHFIPFLKTSCKVSGAHATGA